MIKVHKIQDVERTVHRHFIFMFIYQKLDRKLEFIQKEIDGKLMIVT